jgi:cytochrome c biogenesis protein CcdA/thiol-disulfide isomerase/thioredoxin
MILFAVSYLGGVLTILSPCILPVLPFIFARADKPFLQNGLPLLIGMAVTFAAVATLAAVGGGWVVQANQYGRFAALGLLALFGLTLLVPELAERLTRPLVAIGARLSKSADERAQFGSSFATSLLLGVATGLLWAPCAGPILGLVLTGAALQGANAQTSLLLLAYALGAATSLALALFIGGRVFDAMKRSLGAGEWIRRGLGLTVLCGVAAIAFGLDTGFLTKLSLARTTNIEQALVDRTKPQKPGEASPPSVVTTGGSDAKMSATNVAPPGAMMMMSGKPGMASPTSLPIEGQLPSLAGAVEWLNSPPLTAEALRGKVVLIDFWTYSCINCLRTLPYIQAWAAKYKDQGLVVIGVHSPEFAFEKDEGNVRRAVQELKLGYPVAIDNDYAIWRSFHNQFWPAHYFIDGQGRIRHHHFGEGEYDQSEKIIQQLLAEAGKSGIRSDLVSINASGAEAAADLADVGSPETYIGYERAEKFASVGGAKQDAPQTYSLDSALTLNQWGLTGDWTIGAERAVLNRAGGGITYRFHARDLHLVLGPGADGKPVRFRILIDGHAPSGDQGVDVDAHGNGIIAEQRLYQLVRQSGPIKDRLFEIEFLDPGVQAFAFTFG